ncbi:MAG: helix-turn-helix transcriptional regulator [Chloroflexota bacterium]
MDEQERRQALADFLRTRRARLQPADVGLPARNRRRTQGLRREEVAELADIGVSWYTLLEQAQDVRPSREVLENLAQALQLTPVENQHLMLLAGHEVAAKTLVEEADMTPALQRFVDALSPNPAYAIGRLWNIVAWNRAADWLFHFEEPCPPYSRHALWRFFSRAELQALDSDWETRARTLVALFRADYALYPDEPIFRTVLEDLRRISPQFRCWWEEQDVSSVPDGPRIIQHPALGTLEFDHITLQTAISPDVHVKVYTASPTTRLKLEAISF